LAVLSPINPMMVDYSNLSYIFNTDDGAAERSALSVSAHFVVSVGKHAQQGLARTPS
jgi:hypothetical protein